MDIEIQYREEEGEVGVPIATLPFTRENIDSIIPLIQGWGIFSESSGLWENVKAELFGQFRVLDNKVVFEVVNPA